MGKVLESLCFFSVLMAVHGYQMPNLAQSLLSLGAQPAPLMKHSDIPQPMAANTAYGPQREIAPEGGRHPSDDKRYTISQLNQAARHRNVYFDRMGGDPYGSASSVMSHHSNRGKKRRSVDLNASPRLFAPGQKFPAQPFISKYQMTEIKKRNEIAKMNFAARHRNVYLDTVGGDPYGGSSNVITHQHVLWRHRHRRGETEDEEEKAETRKALYKKMKLD